VRSFAALGLDARRTELGHGQAAATAAGGGGTGFRVRAGRSAAMKWLFGFAVFFWTSCGLLGAWWLDDHRFKTIAKGPISLAKAYNENPPNYPGPS
jgi:hypothetical protein